MSTAALTHEALSLLRSYRGDIVADDANREACRELADHGLLVAGHDFTRGREAFYRMTELGLKFVDSASISGPSPAESASRRP